MSELLHYMGTKDTLAIDDEGDVRHIDDLVGGAGGETISELRDSYWTARHTVEPVTIASEPAWSPTDALAKTLDDESLLPDWGKLAGNDRD